MKDQRDYEAFKKEVIERMKGQPPGKGMDTVLRPMLKEFLEAMLEGEMDTHLVRGLRTDALPAAQGPL